MAVIKRLLIVVFVLIFVIFPVISKEHKDCFCECEKRTESMDGYMIKRDFSGPTLSECTSQVEWEAAKYFSQH